MKWILVLFLGVIAAAQGPATPPPACEDCPDPSRPWMRGAIEIMCTRPAKLPEKQKEHVGHNVVPCEMCKHKCDPLNERASETGNLAWDNRCSARCSPKGCSCENPCDS
jgi:hypothetical protein